MEQLAGLDASFLYLETPTQPMHVVLCAVFDSADAPAPLTLDRLRTHVAGRLALVPSFTRRLIDVPLNLHRPFWAHDPAVDLDTHVCHHSLAGERGQDEDDDALQAFVAELARQPLDRSRPLWELWLVEGLAHGRIAIVIKVHHAALDGIAGVVQLVALFDLEREPQPTEPDELPVADEIPTDAELARWAATDRLRHSIDAVPVLARTARSLWSIGRARRQPGTARPGATPIAAPASPINGPVGGDRTVAFGRLALDDIHRIRKTVSGATVNDVVLATCAGALRRYLVSRGEVVDAPFVAVCPVNTRREEDAGRSDNRVSAMFVSLPIDVTDPRQRLRETHANARGAKGEHDLLAQDLVADLADLADPNALRLLAGLYTRTQLADRHRPAVNLIVSNVPGPPFPLYLAGHRLERAYPMGQILDSIGLNITVMSYCDAVDIGLMAATNLLPDLPVLRDAIADSFAELLAVAE